MRPSATRRRILWQRCTHRETHAHSREAAVRAHCARGKRRKCAALSSLSFSPALCVPRSSEEVEGAKQKGGGEAAVLRGRKRAHAGTSKNYAPASATPQNTRGWLALPHRGHAGGPARLSSEISSCALRFYFGEALPPPLLPHHQKARRERARPLGSGWHRSLKGNVTRTGRKPADSFRVFVRPSAHLLEVDSR